MQVLVNILISASTILLIALGFALVYRTVRFFHFAHAIVFTSGAYFAFACHEWAGLPLVLAVPAGVLLSACVGCLIELMVYRPLRSRNASSLVLLLASLGVYIALQNIVSMFFGDDTKLLRIGSVSEGIDLLGARITPVQIATVITAVALTAAVVVCLTKTRVGLALRAVASDKSLSSISGVPGDLVILVAFAAGSALAATAGVLVALSSDMTPTMGMNPLMLAVVAVIVGGAGKTYGLICASLFLAGAQQTVVWHFGAQWQDPMAFVILLLCLLCHPGRLVERIVPLVAHRRWTHGPV